MNTSRLQNALVQALNKHSELAIAVSGGVDSMTLAYIAHEFSSADITVVHAVSPAVPQSATQRIERFAQQHGWTMRFIDARELSNPMYASNPVDRCFYCKTNLYSHIAQATSLPIASGTNVDDLDDFRPGLNAAVNHHVFHPYVEAAICKGDVYALANAHGLTELASLNAQPCLSSRIETGIEVDGTTLNFVELMESGLADKLPPQDSIRCRITSSGVVVECTLPDDPAIEHIEAWATKLCTTHGRTFVGFRKYRRGSAFLRVAS
jgi:pyridinium-3,5-biscarboxylic acid mononucleotide sulfurtransferase